MFNMPEYVVDFRRSICESCEFRNSLVCGKCGCIIKMKTMIPSTACPEKKWDAYTTTKPSQ
jgi:hypothetical protein